MQVRLQLGEDSRYRERNGERSDPNTSPERNVNAIRRRRGARRPKLSEAQHRTLPRDWRQDGGKRDVCDRGRPRPCRTEPSLWAGTGESRATKFPGAVEESERLIVALTPGESQEEQRGRSQKGEVSD